jgi:hypothetical protein
MYYMFTVIYSTSSYLEINAHTQGDMLICRFIHVVSLLGADSVVTCMERYVEC